MKKSILAITVCGITLFGSFDAISKTSKSVENKPAVELPKSLITTTEYETALKKIWSSPSAKKMKRSIAATDGLSEAQANRMMSQSFKDLKKKIISLKTTKELDTLLRKLDFALHKGDIKDADTQFFAAQFVLIRPWRSITWKMIPVAEKTRVVHSSIITAIRNLSKNWGVMFPNSQWTIGLDYVTEPFSLDETQFVDENDFHNYLKGSMYTELKHAYSRVKKINFKESIWDNQLLYGRFGTFKDDHYRFKKITEADRQVALAGFASGMANIMQFAAYHTHGLLEIAERVGKAFGMDGYAFDERDGTTDENIRKQLLKARKKHPQLLTLRVAGRGGVDGSQLMKYAHTLHSTSITHISLAWNEIKAGRAETERLINPHAFEGHKGSIDSSLKNSKAMLHGSRPVTSKATGKTVLVDLRKFYHNPPTDLYALLPYKFNEIKNRCPSNATETKNWRGSMKCGDFPVVRNYKWGSATHWWKAEHRRYLPNLKSDTDVAEQKSIIGESSSGWFTALPLAIF